MTFKLITEIFKNLETRGKDASGYWGIINNNKKNIVYNKKNVNSSYYIKTDNWNILGNYDFKLLIMHSRAASRNYGNPKNNINNHPFVSDDYKTSFVHNGTLYREKYNYLKNNYKLKSECDSELLFKIYKEKEDIKGIKKIFSLNKDLEMAICIGQVKKNKEKIYLFRNKYRPLYLFDFRKTLGQIFFCSTEEIFLNSLNSIEINKNYIEKSYSLKVKKNSIVEIINKKNTKLNIKEYKVLLNE